MNSSETAKARNTGIDLLRLVSMYMVVVLHLVGMGGTISDMQSGLVLGLREILQSLVWCSVNCFALISGYVGYRPAQRGSEQRGLKLKSYVKLWMQVFFWSITLFFAAIPLHWTEFSSAGLLKALFPVCSRSYWYFTAYTAVFFLAPAMNRMIAGMSRRTRSAVMTGILCFSVLVTVLESLDQDPFQLELGYCVPWLCILYVTGGILRANEQDAERIVPRKVIAYTAVFCVLITALVRMYTLFPLYLYISPAMVLLAICLLKLFAGMKPGPVLRRVTTFAAPAAFGIYLIHVHKSVFAPVIEQRFGWIADLPGVLPVIVTLAVALGIFLVCLLLELLRIALFRVIRADRLAERVASLLERGFYRLSEALSALY